MVGKLFTLIGKLIGLALLALAVGVAALAGYFYIKSGEPMQVAEAQRLAPGITLREYMRYTHTVWEKADDKSVAAGNNRSCVLVYGIVEPIVGFISVPFQVNHYRAIVGTPAFAQYVEYLNGDPPPNDLLTGPWWNLPKAYWWQFEYGIWSDTYLPGGNCRVRPLSPAAHSQTGNP
jgi:hypothetical protein